MKDNEGGFIVPESVAAELYADLGRDNLWRSLMPKRDYPPLTLRQRFRLWRYDLRWRLHDWMFGHHCTDDD